MYYYFKEWCLALDRRALLKLHSSSVIWASSHRDEIFVVDTFSAVTDRLPDP